MGRRSALGIFQQALVISFYPFIYSLYFVSVSVVTNVAGRPWWRWMLHDVTPRSLCVGTEVAFDSFFPPYFPIHALPRFFLFVCRFVCRPPGGTCPTLHLTLWNRQSALYIKSAGMTLPQDGTFVSRRLRLRGKTRRTRHPAFSKAPSGEEEEKMK